MIDESLRVDKSFDIGKRELTINDKQVIYYYVTGLIDNELVNDIITGMIRTHSINSLQVEEVKEVKDFTVGVLSGLLGIRMDEKMILVDTRNYPTRSPSEPDAEKVVRGSRDGFTENLIVNTALIRRRIRTPYLVNKLYKIGSDSKTDVCLCYIENLADKKLIEILDEKLKNIETQEITMSDKALEELLVKNKFNPYPLVRYTERPDSFAVHLFQGQIGIIVDNSPSAILAPTTIFEHLEHAEEYRQRPLVGSFIRLLRIIGILISLFLMPIWLLFANNPNLTSIYVNTESNIMIPIIAQILMVEIGMEFLRIAAIHTPTAISSAVGVIAGILVGEMAIEAGLFSLQIILYSAISQIGSYATPSYELSLANKISKLFFLIATYFFNLYGLIFSVILWIIMLARTKSLNKPYLYPLIPFNFKKLVQVIIRFPKDTFKNK